VIMHGWRIHRQGRNSVLQSYLGQQMKCTEVVCSFGDMDHSNKLHSAIRSKVFFNQTVVYLFMILGFELRAFTLSHSTSPFS
jgi:hypothetical protein